MICMTEDKRNVPGKLSPQLNLARSAGSQQIGSVGKRSTFATPARVGLRNHQLEDCICCLF